MHPLVKKIGQTIVPRVFREKRCHRESAIQRELGSQLNYLPNVLLIGAAKAGTSSLAADLAQHPDIFLPSCKEPHCLCDVNSVTPAGIQSYESYFEQTPLPVLLDASTGYSMVSKYAGVPNRAKKILGSDLQIIYFTRDPIERATSHHFHLCRARRCHADFSVAIRENDDIIDTGRYFKQISPWLEVFNRNQIHLFDLEHYRSDREAVLKSLFQSMGIDSEIVPKEQKPQNVGREMNIAKAKTSFLVGAIHYSNWYKKLRERPSIRLLRRVGRSFLMAEHNLQKSSVNEKDRMLIRESMQNEIPPLLDLYRDHAPTWLQQWNTPKTHQIDS